MAKTGVVKVKQTAEPEELLNASASFQSDVLKQEIDWSFLTEASRCLKYVGLRLFNASEVPK